MTKSKITREKLIFLDGLRGLAAFYVLVGHARWLLWEGHTAYLSHPQEYSWLETAQVYFFAAFRYGHQAVLFFFVLSGFLIHLGYAKKLIHTPERSFDFWNYLKRRTRRIYPPLLFALGITFVLDLLGTQLGYSIYRGETLYPLINENVRSSISWPIFLGNLAFLMDAYVPPFGTNGPLWSLKYEWWFYMFYPLFWVLTKRSIALATGIMGLLFLLSFWPSYWPSILLQQVFALMLSWWLGALLADVYSGRIAIPFSWLIPLILALAPGILAVSSSIVINDTLCAIGFIGLLSGCFFLQRNGFSLGGLLKLKWLGDCSYTLYVIHFPLIALFSGYLMSRNPQLPSHFGFVWVGIIGAVVLSYGVHFLVEKPFTSRRPKSG